MNGFHKLFRFAVAACLTSFVVAAIAAPVVKQYSLLVQQNFATYTNGVVNTPVPTTLYVKNEAPPGTANSNIGSFTVTVVGTTIAPSVPVQCSVGTCSQTSPNTLVVTNISALQAQQQLRVDFATASCGDAHWLATVYNGSQLSGQTFSLRQDPDFFGDGTMVASDQVTNTSCGSVDCSGVAFVVPDSTSPATTSLAYVTGVRTINKDGTCSTTGIDYFVSNALFSNGRLHFRWPVSTSEVNPQAAAVFRYTINLPTSSASVAWLNADGSPATDPDPALTPYFIPAPACLTNVAPAPYAQLATAISSTARQFNVVNSVNVGSLPRRPFPAVIGSERILVQQVSGNGTWTVLRAQGGTAPTGHNATDAVMSTPLPILPAPIGPYFSAADPTQPVQAQVCMIGSPVKNSGDTTWKATFFDIGDAWTGIR
jgi:hypothetical protein